MKRFLAILCAVLMVCALCAPTFADTTGTITITNTVKDQAYSVYQMATLESYVEDSAYSYKPVTAWVNFFTGKSEYFQIVDGYVSLKDGVTLDANASAQLAKDALAYAKNNKIAVTGEAKTAAADDEEIVFSELGLGYYLVDSSLGAFCGLTTTDPNASVQEKNAKPEVKKEVQEDSTQEWGETNDADFYQTVNFKTTITVQKGAQNYVLHDKMEKGLTYTAITAITVDGTTVPEASYTVTASGTTDGCAFEIAFDNTYIASLAVGKEIVVEYTAYLNDDADIAGDGNYNETWLKYGDNNETTHDFTYTYVYEFDLVKTDADNKLLDGAEFRLYTAATGGEEITVVKEADGTYRVAKDVEPGVAIEVTGGKATITGLDGGTTYYLEETVAPEGYNKLTARKDFKIESSNLKATEENSAYKAGTGVQIVNKTGSILPETGGIGTVLFTVIGSILVIGAGILLIAKKRMSKMA